LNNVRWNSGNTRVTEQAWFYGIMRRRLYLNHRRFFGTIFRPRAMKAHRLIRSPLEPPFKSVSLSLHRPWNTFVPRVSSKSFELSKCNIYYSHARGALRGFIFKFAQRNDYVDGYRVTTHFKFPIRYYFFSESNPFL